MPKRHTKKHTKKRNTRSKNRVINGSKYITKNVTSGLNNVGKTVTGTSQKMVNRFFGLFSMKKSRKHRRK
jgi:hypothetical protein